MNSNNEDVWYQSETDTEEINSNEEMILNKVEGHDIDQTR